PSGGYLDGLGWLDLGTFTLTFDATKRLFPVVAVVVGSGGSVDADGVLLVQLNSSQPTAPNTSVLGDQQGLAPLPQVGFVVPPLGGPPPPQGGTTSPALAPATGHPVRQLAVSSPSPNAPSSTSAPRLSSRLLLALSQPARLVDAVFGLAKNLMTSSASSLASLLPSSDAGGFARTESRAAPRELAVTAFPETHRRAGH